MLSFILVLYSAVFIYGLRLLMLGTIMLVAPEFFRDKGKPDFDTEIVYLLESDYETEWLLLSRFFFSSTIF